MPLSAFEISNSIIYNNINVEVYDIVTSTNTLVKERGYQNHPQGLVIVAEAQTAGRGRMGREFFSPNQTGVYFSILLRPKLSPDDSLFITTAAAVACARVLERISNQKAEIKWVNDIYINQKKVCGILTEASFANGKIDFAVLGIGINLYTPKDGFPTEIKDKAGSVFKFKNSDSRAIIIAEIINEFFAIYETIENREFIEEYCNRSMLDGMKINVLKSDSIIPATALCIAPDLSLAVQYSDGTIEHLSSGDVTIAKL